MSDKLQFVAALPRIVTCRSLRQTKVCRTRREKMSDKLQFGAKKCPTNFSLSLMIGDGPLFSRLAL